VAKRDNFVVAVFRHQRKCQPGIYYSTPGKSLWGIWWPCKKSFYDEIQVSPR